jgi:hypothetical protein
MNGHNLNQIRLALSKSLDFQTSFASCRTQIRGFSYGRDVKTQHEWQGKPFQAERWDGLWGRKHDWDAAEMMKLNWRCDIVLRCRTLPNVTGTSGWGLPWGSMNLNVRYHPRLDGLCGRSRSRWDLPWPTYEWIATRLVINHQIQHFL